MSKPVLLIRGTGNVSDSQALSELGISSLVDPFLEIAISDAKNDAAELFDYLTESSDSLWLIATSVNAIRYWADIVGTENLADALSTRKNLHYAAIGQATADALQELGASKVVLPPSATSDSLLSSLLEYPPSTALIPGGNLAMTGLPRGLEAAGWNVRTGIVYTTSPIGVEPKSVSQIRNGEIAAVLLRSPSAARAFFSHVPDPDLLIVCAGPTTAKAVAELGIKVDAVAEDPTPGTVAATILALLTRQES